MQNFHKLPGSCIVVDANPNFRAFMVFALKNMGLSVTECTEFANLPSLLQKNNPSAILIDTSSFGYPALDAQTQIQSLCNASVIHMLGSLDPNLLVDLAKNSATAILLKPFSLERLTHALEKAHTAKTSSDDKKRNQVRAGSIWEELTEREQDVCQFMIKGFSNKQIAIRMNVAADTIKKHRARILEKGNVADLPEMIEIFKDTQHIVECS